MLRLRAFLWCGLCAMLPLNLGCAAGTQGTAVHFRLNNADRVLTHQRRGDWCWAACCEMALKYNMVNDITQEMLVDKLKGKQDDQTAIDAEIVLALATEPTRDTVQLNHAPSRIDVNTQHLTDALFKLGSMYISSDKAIEDFGDGHPVLLGLKDWEGAPAHIVFVTAIEATDHGDVSQPADVLDGIVKFPKTVGRMFGQDRYTLSAIEFFDPMPETGGPTRMTAEEIKPHVRFYLSRKRAREIIDNAHSTVMFH